MPERSEDFARTVSNVHRWAHAHFRYEPDTTRWQGQLAPNGDHWETREQLLDDIEKRGEVVGDCDAFAMLCWLAMRDLNEKARLVLCQTENGGWHLVCEASGWILDNRQPVPATRDELERIGYTWHSKSGFGPGEQWTTAL